jgi:hypothetical protein
MPNETPFQTQSSRIVVQQMPGFKFPNGEYEQLDPPEYGAHGFDIHDRAYPLPSRGSTSPFMASEDLEVQRKKVRDERLKQRIRKFRFVVRALDLGCR